MGKEISLWNVVLVSAVTSAIVFSFMQAFYNNAGFSPLASASPISGQPIINANECTKDSVCEVNSLISSVKGNSSNSSSPSSSTTTILGGAINTTEIATDIIEASGQVHAGQLTSNYGVSARWVQAINPNQGYVTLNHGNIEATSLRGNGSAYACVDFLGRFYRSVTPCVS